MSKMNDCFETVVIRKPQREGKDSMTPQWK